MVENLPWKDLETAEGRTRYLVCHDNFATLGFPHPNLVTSHDTLHDLVAKLTSPHSSPLFATSIPRILTQHNSTQPAGSDTPSLTSAQEMAAPITMSGPVQDGTLSSTLSRPPATLDQPESIHSVQVCALNTAASSSPPVTSDQPSFGSNIPPVVNFPARAPTVIVPLSQPVEQENEAQGHVSNSEVTRPSDTGGGELQGDSAKGLGKRKRGQVPQTSPKKLRLSWVQNVQPEPTETPKTTTRLVPFCTLVYPSYPLL